MSKCHHSYKPVVRAGPSYVFGVYAGIDHFGTDYLACTKCGHRRRPMLHVIGHAICLIVGGALGLAGASLLIAFTVMCMRVATESWG